jgi:hypothetical protein
MEKLTQNQREWLNYASGYWGGMPTTPGRYSTRSVDGTRGNDIDVFVNTRGDIVASELWGGYWWSVPVPSLPDTGFNGR